MDEIDAKDKGILTFGERLHDLRKDKGLTQNELGEIVGVGKKVISCYENGKSFPKQETLRKLAEYFGVSYDYMVGVERYNSRDIKLKDTFAMINGEIVTFGEVITQLMQLDHKNREPLLDAIALLSADDGDSFARAIAIYKLGNRDRK